MSLTNKYTFRSLGMLGQMYDPIGGEANFPDGTEFYLASDIDARTSEPSVLRSCHCPALPGEDCLLTSEECLKRAAKKSTGEHGG